MTDRQFRSFLRSVKPTHERTYKHIQNVCLACGVSRKFGKCTCKDPPKVTPNSPPKSTPSHTPAEWSFEGGEARPTWDSSRQRWRFDSAGGTRDSVYVTKAPGGGWEYRAHSTYADPVPCGRRYEPAVAAAGRVAYNLQRGTAPAEKYTWGNPPPRKTILKKNT